MEKIYVVIVALVLVAVVGTITGYNQGKIDGRQAGIQEVGQLIAKSGYDCQNGAINCFNYPKINKFNNFSVSLNESGNIVIHNMSSQTGIEVFRTDGQGIMNGSTINRTNSSSEGILWLKGEVGNATLLHNPIGFYEIMKNPVYGNPEIITFQIQYGCGPNNNCGYELYDVKNFSR